MDDTALKLLRAQHLIEAANRERFRLEHELKQARLEVTRLRRAVVSLQRQQTKEREGQAHA